MAKAIPTAMVSKCSVKTSDQTVVEVCRVQ